MDSSKSVKQQIMELAGEKLLEKLKEFKDSKQKASRDSSEQRLVDEVGRTELVSEASTSANTKSDSKELVRYHSVVELDTFEDEFDSCANSTENIHSSVQEQEKARLLDSTKNWLQPTPASKPPTTLPDNSIPICAPKPESPNSELSNFVQKKSIAQGMMDLALVSANTNQLRYVMDIGTRHPYFYTSIALIVTSLAMQLVVGLALIYNSRFNIRKKNEMRSADRINDLSVIGVFLITLVNVFISTFNGSNAGIYTSDTIPMSDENVTTVAPDVASAINVSVDGS
ncbi:ninjurin-A-like [Aedes albopictus]|uniref:Ninjurin a n=1 Tax=Aedes albopictus TaxID=7160 RepID=A0ABM1ZKG8_AEDAL